MGQNNILFYDPKNRDCNKPQPFRRVLKIHIYDTYRQVEHKTDFVCPSFDVHECEREIREGLKLRMDEITTTILKRDK